MSFTDGLCDVRYKWFYKLKCRCFNFTDVLALDVLLLACLLKTGRLYSDTIIQASTFLSCLLFPIFADDFVSHISDSFPDY